jgi:hypothetical protein
MAKALWVQPTRAGAGKRRDGSPSAIEMGGRACPQPPHPFASFDLAEAGRTPAYSNLNTCTPNGANSVCIESP